MQYQAKNIASGLLQNCGHNCVGLEVGVERVWGKCGVWNGGMVGAAAELWTQLCGPGDGCGRDAGSVVCGGRVGRGCHRTAGTAALS